MSATKYRGGGIKGRAILNRNHAKHALSSGVKQRSIPHFGINLINLACDEFFKSRNMSATAYGIRDFGGKEPT